MLWGVFRFHVGRAEWRTARELAEQLLRLTESVQDPALLMEAHRGLGATLFWLGEFVSARAHLEQGIALYDPLQHRSHAFLYGQDPGVMCLSQAALALWGLGYPDQVLKRLQEALTLAQEVSHPSSLATALNWAVALHQFRREVQTVQEQAEAAMTLATEQGFAVVLATATTLQGWALAMLGQVEEGIAQMCRGLAAYRATGAELARPSFLHCWPRRMGKQDRQRKDLPRWSTLSLRWRRLGSVSTRPSCIG